MGLFSGKLSQAQAQIAHLTSLLAVFGLEPEASVDDARTRLAALEAAPDAGAQQALAEAQAAAASAAERATAATADLARAQADVTTLRTAIAYPAGAPLEPEALQAHVQAQTSAAAARVVAGAGHEQPLPVPVGSDSAEGAETLEELRERLRSETDPKRAGLLAERVRKARDRAWRN